MHVTAGDILDELVRVCPEFHCEYDGSRAEAAYTCFLENIAGEPPAGTLTPFLSAAAVEFMDQ